MKISDDQRKRMIKARQHGLSLSESMEFAGIRSRTTAWRIWKNHLATQRDTPKPAARRHRQHLTDDQKYALPSEFVEVEDNVEPAVALEAKPNHALLTSGPNNDDERALAEIAKTYGHLAAEGARHNPALQRALTAKSDERGTPRVRSFARGVDPNPGQLGPDQELLDHTKRDVDIPSGLRASRQRSRRSPGIAFPTGATIGSPFARRPR